MTEKKNIENGSADTSEYIDCPPEFVTAPQYSDVLNELMQHTNTGWQILYHQGTIVEDG